MSSERGTIVGRAPYLQINNNNKRMIIGDMNEREENNSQKTNGCLGKFGHIFKNNNCKKMKIFWFQIINSLVGKEYDVQTKIYVKNTKQKQKIYNQHTTRWKILCW